MHIYNAGKPTSSDAKTKTPKEQKGAEDPCCKGIYPVLLQCEIDNLAGYRQTNGNAPVPDILLRELFSSIANPLRDAGCYRIFCPSPDSTSSTPRSAVRLCSSKIGLISTTSSETMASESAIISIARCASR